MHDGATFASAPVAETLIPTCGFRWIERTHYEPVNWPFHGSGVEVARTVTTKTLQQRFQTMAGAMVWRDVPTVQE